MKKIYEAPTVEVYMMETSMMIATSPTPGFDQNDEQDSEDAAPGHRGEWGQIWN